MTTSRSDVTPMYIDFPLSTPVLKVREEVRKLGWPSFRVRFGREDAPDTVRVIRRKR